MQKPADVMRISEWSSDVCSSDLPPVIFHCFLLVCGRLGPICLDVIARDRALPATSEDLAVAFEGDKFRLDVEGLGVGPHGARALRADAPRATPNFGRPVSPGPGAQRTGSADAVGFRAREGDLQPLAADAVEASGVGVLDHGLAGNRVLADAYHRARRTGDRGTPKA